MNRASLRTHNPTPNRNPPPSPGSWSVSMAPAPTPLPINRTCIPTPILLHPEGMPDRCRRWSFATPPDYPPRGPHPDRVPERLARQPSPPSVTPSESCLRFTRPRRSSTSGYARPSLRDACAPAQRLAPMPEPGSHMLRGTNLAGCGAGWGNFRPVTTGGQVG